MSWHPEVRAACARAVDEYGPSACASRMTTGNSPVYGLLERDLARFFGVPDPLLTSCGYFAPLAAAQALAPDHTHVLLDERAHACLVDAAALTGLPVRRFAHRDPAALGRELAAIGRGRAIVMTDGLFSHSGEVAPLAEYLEVLPRRSVLLVDDAHGLGALGARGRGTLEHCRVPVGRIVLTATLSKALGCYGGVIVGPPGFRARVLDRSRIITGNTAVPPPSAAGVRAALEVLRVEGRERRRRLALSAKEVKGAVRTAGASIPEGPGPMFSLAPRSPAAVRRLTRMLLDAGIYPCRIAYPNGPAPEYFRFALSSEHTAEQVAALRETLVAFHGGSQ